MEILGIGPGELLLVFILALIFVGPGKMPEVAASLGKAFREFQRASAELTDALNAEIAAAEARKAIEQAGENNRAQVADAAQTDVVAQAEAVVQAASEVEPVAYSGLDSIAEAATSPSVEPTSSAELPVVFEEPTVAGPSSTEPTHEPAQVFTGETGILFGLEPLPAALLTPSVLGELPPAVAPAGPESSANADPESKSSEPPIVETGQFFGLEPLPASLLAPSEPDGVPTTPRPAELAGQSPPTSEPAPESAQPVDERRETSAEVAQLAAVAGLPDQAVV